MGEITQDYQGRYVIWGPPGTGKTRFLAEQVKEIVRRLGTDLDRSPVCVCSLTRTAASEIASRDMPIPRRQVGTLHAHAYRQLGTPAIAEVMVRDWNEDRPEYAIDPKAAPRDVDDLAWEREERQDELGGNELYSEYNLLRARMVPRERWNGRVTVFARAWEEWKASNDLIDFTDMIELALQDVGTAPGTPEVIIADEAQDHSALEHALIEKWSAAAGASMIAGDFQQALYTWRGADPSIFVDPSVPEDHRGVLHQSYRVPEKVRRAATRWVSQLSDYVEADYRAREDEETHRTVQGELRFSPYTYKAPDFLVPEIVKSLEAGRTVMICASCSYMLKPTVSVLREEGIPFSNPRRRCRADWNPLGRTRGVSMVERLLDFLRIDDRTFSKDAPYASQRSRVWSGGELERWAAIVRKENLMRRGAARTIEKLALDYPNQALPPPELSKVLTVDGLRAIMAGLGPDATGTTQTTRLVAWLFEHARAGSRRSLGYLKEIIRRWGPRGLREKPRLYVGTIHSFKGFEADHVFLFPDLSPAGLHEWTGTDSDSVIRTFYVAMTRAREIVTFCEPCSASSVEIGDLAMQVA